jgi:hypothetical protein
MKGRMRISDELKIMKVFTKVNCIVNEKSRHPGFDPDALMSYRNSGRRISVRSGLFIENPF